MLANLLATWLAAHRVRGGRLQTILLRGRVFQDHMKIIRDLTKLNAMRMELEDIQAECDLNQGDHESAPRAGLSNPSARQ